jgi:hypothetical protein
MPGAAQDARDELVLKNKKKVKKNFKNKKKVKKNFKNKKKVKKTQPKALRDPFFTITYNVFHRFGHAKFGYGGLDLGSSQFSILPQMPQK